MWPEKEGTELRARWAGRPGLIPPLPLVTVLRPKGSGIPKGKASQPKPILGCISPIRNAGDHEGFRFPVFVLFCFWNIRIYIMQYLGEGTQV